MITGDIHTLEDGMRVVAGMMRTHHDCTGLGEWLVVAAELEAVAADSAVCAVRREDALRAVRLFLADRDTAEVPA